MKVVMLSTIQAATMLALMLTVVGAFQITTTSSSSNSPITSLRSSSELNMAMPKPWSKIGKGNAVAADNSAPPLKSCPPRKVCLMVEPTPFTHVSGYSNRFKEMLKYLKMAGDDVEIVTVDENTDAKDLPDEHLGYKISHTQGFKWFLYNQVSLTMDIPNMKIAGILDRLKPDIIHVTSPGFMIMPCIFYARVMRIPLLMSYHTHLPSYGKSYLGFIPGIEEFSWSLLRWAHTRTDLTLVTSPQIRNEFIEAGIKNVDVWRKGIDTVRFDPKFKSAAMRDRMSDGNPDDFLITYVGRLGYEKRIMDIKAVLERMPNVRFCVVGGGPHEEALKKHFAGTKTTFLGQLSGDTLSEAFASADTFVMPSDSETLGFVVLEAMASGVPVVGVRAGGVQTLIDDGKDGYLVETSNTDEYVDRLTKLMNDTPMRLEMAKNARKEAERWGWEASMSVLRNIQYEKTIANFAKSRGFQGYGKPRTRFLVRLLRMRWKQVRGVFGKLLFRSA